MGRGLAQGLEDGAPDVASAHATSAPSAAFAESAAATPRAVAPGAAHGVPTQWAFVLLVFMFVVFMFVVFVLMVSSHGVLLLRVCWWNVFVLCVQVAGTSEMADSGQATTQRPQA
jgi:hypothetical protein